MIGDRTRTVIIGVVTFVWAVNFLAGLVPALDYKPDQAINAIFMAVVGGLLAIRKKPGTAKEDDELLPPPPRKRVAKKTVPKRPSDNGEPKEE